MKDFNERLITDQLSLKEWDNLLEQGWDRVGTGFFRRRFDYYTNGLETFQTELMPLRYRLAGFQFSKSQRIVQRRNADLRRIYRPTLIDDEKYELFNDYYFARFGAINTIHTWVSGNETPFPTYEVSVYKLDKLIACSFFDPTPRANYSTLGIHDPNEKRRSLGIFTMISEIEFGLRQRKKFHYPGHAYHSATMYAYKKRFPNAECFDWDTEEWKNLLMVNG